MEEHLEKISEDRLAEFREAFNLFDNDGDGRIGIQELGSIFREIGQRPSDEEIIIMLDEADHLDQHQDGTITFQEFMTLMQKRMTDLDTEEELIEAFRICDKEGKGLIHVDDLRLLMLELGESLPADELAEVIKSADFDNDSFINYVEFVKHVLHK